MKTPRKQSSEVLFMFKMAFQMLCAHIGIYCTLYSIYRFKSMPLLKRMGFHERVQIEFSSTHMLAPVRCPFINCNALWGNSSQQAISSYSTYIKRPLVHVLQCHLNSINYQFSVNIEYMYAFVFHSEHNIYLQ